MTIFNRKTVLRGFLFGLSFGLIGGAATADQAGQREYMDARASCHGPEGGGSGPVSEFMNIVVPALTGLAEANGGAFPMSEAIATFDGRTEVRGHGSGMPVWGAVFADPLAADVTGTSADDITRGRLLSRAL